MTAMGKPKSSNIFCKLVGEGVRVYVLRVLRTKILMESGYVLNIHDRYGMGGSRKWEQEFIKKITDIMHASK